MSVHRPPLPTDIVDQLNAHSGAFSTSLGLRVTQASYQQLDAEMPIGPHLLQPFGLVHGGVYASVAESLASLAAGLHVIAEKKVAVGLENSTTFLRATRSGVLQAAAKPIATGQRTHVWEVHMFNDSEIMVASGRVRLLIIDAPPDSSFIQDRSKIQPQQNQPL
ncbi:MAG: PaaI family thioesterase [Myxococcales bacterium]|nr:PaaI family thioesterase [Myxococcales bacterium]